MLDDIKKWQDNLDDASKLELSKLNEDELYDAFYKDISFGTGGMRGIIGVGTNRINIYTLRSANYGFFKFMQSRYNRKLSVVIAYDNRHKSADFALDSALTLASLGVKVYLFNKITPTPELSFAVRYYKATGGIVITASHNPPKYNGYKIYDDKGCQLVPDLANIVIDNIKTAPSPFSLKLKPLKEYEELGLIETTDDKVDEEYLKNVKSISVNNVKKDDFKIVFSPLHGTSAYLGPRLLKEMGYNYVTVKEQMIADSNFSTVKLPNPEDKNAFDLSIALAKKENADICIATDPDADRVGLAVKDKDEYVLLTGNQTGALLINYLVHYRNTTKKGVLFNTIVTSPLGSIIASDYNIRTFSTLTGFKFIGEQAGLLEDSEEEEFYFGYEESYGYVVKDFVRDKDSLQALLLCSEMACFYKNQGMSLIEVLESIYQKYGYYMEDLINIVHDGASGEKIINRIMTYFRGVNDFNNPKLKVVSKEDYKLSEKKNYKDNSVSKLLLPKSDVLKFYLDDGSWFVFRPSGTEPKIKVYISVHKNTRIDSLNRIKEIKDELMKLV